MDGLKAATPLSALNSVRDFSASGHTSANFKNKYWVCYKKHLSYDNNNLQYFEIVESSLPLLWSPTYDPFGKGMIVSSSRLSLRSISYIRT